jgi:chorismate-pyruvate lyase
MNRRLPILALCLAAAFSSLARPRPEWSDTFESRIEILALLQTLNGEILASSSATRTLEEWCGEHHLADEAKIVARRVPGVRKEPSAEQLQRLGVSDPSAVQYRRVELRCGAHLLSEADNWYVPARLTPEMNALLETTDTPFGKAVQALHPYRRTLAVTNLWSPLLRGWELQPRPQPQRPTRRTMAIPKELFQHRALLYTADHFPFSEVVETYQSELLAFERNR